MSDRIVVDTDVLIDTGRGVEEAISCLSSVERLMPVSISAVTQMEMIIGCRNKDELHLLEAFFDRFQIIELDRHISGMAIKMLKRYRLSHGLLIADALIAATAIVHNAKLVSKNQRDYRFIKELHLLPYPDPFT
ncbi:MAG: type II toxin-antitoxin system VapC family toxin [Deltaproteobacteria bacterium]|nr:type II toxin-antitoxin system VapC family toxin [Deltaproteobacteria bacterium]